MKRRFSLVAARRVASAHLGVFFLLATVPDLLWPELEFGYYWRDTLKVWLLGPALLICALLPYLFSGVLAGLAGFLFSSVSWGLAAGVIWPLFRPAPSFS